MVFGTILLIAAIVATVVVAAVALAKALGNAGDDADKNFSDKPVGAPANSCLPNCVWQWDPPYTSDTKQYVNLPEDVALKYGPDALLKGHIEPRIPGVSVSFTVVPNAANEASTSTATLSGGSATTDDMGEATIKISLPQHGGLKYKVGGKTDSMAKAVDSGEITVWRKLWFEVDTMKKRGGGTLDMDHDKLPAIYEPCFIEIEKQGTDNLPDNIWNLQTADLHGSANDYFGAEKSPYQSHEMGIDHQADKQDGDLTIAMTATVFTNGSADSYYVYDGGDTWLKTAQYDDGSGWKDLDKSKVTLDGASAVYKNIKVDLSAGPVTPTAAKPVPIKLEFIKSKEWSGDGSYTPHAMVAMGYWYDTETVAEAKKRTLGTMAHELGHLLGMVPTSSSTHIDTGTGHHCTDTACVMYSTNTTTRGNSFCSVCSDILRKADLTTYSGAFTHTKGTKA
jgi:hypothetical protein